jgi:Ca2+-transporting ATPase
MPNKALWWVSGGAFFFLILVLEIPAFRNIFQFAPLHPSEMILLSLAGACSIFFAESIKFKVLHKLIYHENE